MAKQIIFQKIVYSDSSSREYKVSKYDDDSWACSCPKWIYCRSPKQDCKHIDDVRANYLWAKKNYAEVNISGIEKDKEKIKKEVSITQINNNNQEIKG